MTSLTQNKWIAFRVSVYLLGAFGLLVIVFMGWVSFTEFANPAIEDILGLGTIILGGLLIIGLQLLHVKMLGSHNSENSLPANLLNAHVVLLVINVLIFAAVVTGLVYIIQGIIRNWKNLYIDIWYRIFYTGWLLLTVSFLYNLIASLLLRKILLREAKSAHETMLNSIGQPQADNQ